MRAALTLDLRSITAAEIVADRILDACGEAGCVHVRAHPLLGLRRDFWQEVVTRHGMQVPVDEDALTGKPTGSLWSDVEFDPAKPGVFRHSSAAQPLHTDGSYIVDPPQIVFLICNRAAAQGGATLFLDGADLVDMLAREQPVLLDALTNTPLRFTKGGCEVEAPVIVRGPNRVSLRWNYFALDRRMPESHRQIAASLRAFLGQVALQNRAREILLQAGDAVFFSDAEVLHGRNAFHALHRGDRCLWKGGLAVHSLVAAGSSS